MIYDRDAGLHKVNESRFVYRGRNMKIWLEMDPAIMFLGDYTYTCREKANVTTANIMSPSQTDCGVERATFIIQRLDG